MQDCQPPAYTPSMTRKVPNVVAPQSNPQIVTNVFHLLHYLLGGDQRSPRFYELNNRRLLELGVALNKAEPNSGICIDNGVHFGEPSEDFARVNYMTKSGPLADGELPRSDNELSLIHI